MFTQKLYSCLSVRFWSRPNQGVALTLLNDLQELLDLKQNQRSGTQLVADIRKQADNVL